MKQFSRNIVKQAGVSVLEVLISLAIIGLVIAAAVGGAVLAFSAQSTNNITSEVVSLRNTTKNFYSKATSYGTASLNANLIAAKAFPDYLKVNASTGVVTNSFGGNIDITGATTAFTISYTLVPQDVCVKHIAISGSGGLQTVAVNGGSALPVPISPSSAVTACNAATNSIVWTTS